MNNSITRKGIFLAWLLLSTVAGATNTCTSNVNSTGISSSNDAAGPTVEYPDETTTAALSTSHPWLLPPDDSGVLASLFGSIERQEEFFVHDFGQRMVHLPFSLRSPDSQQMPSILQNIDVEELYDASPVTLRNRSSMDLVNTQRMSYATFQESVIDQQGGSATFEITVLEPEDRFAVNPLLPFKRQLEHALGLPLSFNVYHSGPGGSALQQHADRYDVFVIQLEGAKEWTLCPPREEHDTSINNINNQADTASLSDTQYREDDKRPCGVNMYDVGYMCCKETDVTLRQGMDCRKLTMRKGDILYMPQGIVHSAVVPSTHSVSTHAAIGLKKVPFRYADLMSTFLQLVASVSDSPQVWNRLQQWLEKDILESPTEGLVFRRLLPPWIWRHYQACLGEQQDDKHRSRSSSPSMLPPPPRYWKCDMQKHQEAKRFLLTSLQDMVVILQDLAYQHVQSTASQKDPPIGGLDYLVMTEYFETALVMPLSSGDVDVNDAQPQPSLFQDAINVHLTEKIKFDTLEGDERDEIQQSRNMQRETAELMKSMFGGLSTGGSGGGVTSSSSSSSDDIDLSMSEFVESLRSDVKSRQRRSSSSSSSSSSSDDTGLSVSELVESLRSDVKSRQRRRASYLASQHS